ncbi:hypothetical protein AZL_025530 [Azospirillum sp. B510]|uniref:hypothetical protein n=1 Tax=Azospirillum sp. (strain B510) TaxID=137722 RepID=UPI0001C4CBF7|nr:hypothetical protein [Azospirillum sp. B510]BAI73191.1 hypothetical protein AZL_025530 [Azospirillum sp. B510]
MAKRSTGQLHLFHQVAAVAAPTATVQISIFEQNPDFAPPSFRPRAWWKEARKAMSQIRTELQVAPEGVGLRWAEALGARYAGAHQAKRIAQDFGVEPRTAQSWLGGQPPLCKHLCRAALVHGHGIVLEVLLPGTPLEREARLDAELRAVEARLDGLRRTIAELRA